MRVDTAHDLAAGATRIGWPLYYIANSVQPEVKESTMRTYMQSIVVQVVYLSIATSVCAADLDMVLTGPESSVHGGDKVLMALYLLNHTDTIIIRDLPSSLACQVKSGQSTFVLDAGLVGGEAMSRLEVPARGFAERHYAVAIPVDVLGPIQIQLEAMDTNPLTITVGKPRPETLIDQQVSLDSGETMAQSFLDDLSVYKPMYFLLGVYPGLEESKFQISFKYRLFNPEGYLAEKAPWLSGFHLGYTQRSIWDLKNDSKPFEDTSYMPELFYLLPKIDLNVDRINAFGIQGGFEHESNGRSGDDSRSTNYLYLRPILGVRLIDGVYLKIAPEIFTYVNNSESTNDDLKDYRGYFDLEVGIIDPDGLALNAQLWWAKEGPTVQVDLTYPMTKLMSKSLNFYLDAQYFSGYAETLLHYNERHEAFRLGFSIVR